MVNKSVIFIALWLLLPVALASQPPYYHPGFHAVPMVSQSGRADIAITTGLANVSPCLSVSANWFPAGQWVVDGAVMGFGKGLRLYTHWYTNYPIEETNTAIVLQGYQYHLGTGWWMHTTNGKSTFTVTAGYGAGLTKTKYRESNYYTDNSVRSTISPHYWYLQGTQTHRLSRVSITGSSRMAILRYGKPNGDGFSRVLAEEASWLREFDRMLFFEQGLGWRWGKSDKIKYQIQLQGAAGFARGDYFPNIMLSGNVGGGVLFGG